MDGRPTDSTGMQPQEVSADSEFTSWYKSPGPSPTPQDYKSFVHVSPGAMSSTSPGAD